MPRIPSKIAALCGLLALAACGGGADGQAPAGAQAQATAPVPAPAPAPVPMPAPAPAPAVSNPAISHRIEPLDTGLLPEASAKSGATHAADSARPAPASAAPPQPSVLRLGPLSAQQLPTETAQRADAAGVAQQIGVARALTATQDRQQLLALLRWQTDAGGAQRAALSVTSEGARGLRLGLLVRSLPAHALLRFYAQAGGAVHSVPGREVLRSVQRNLDSGDGSDAARTWWAPDIGGAEVTLEIELPAGADPEQLDIALPWLSHLYAAADADADADASADADAGAGAKNLGDAESCNIDVSCRIEYERESRAVARVSYVQDGATYKCTGTLLNDAGASRRPWFLTAHHCIGTQTLASTVVTDWFYRSSACNSGVPNPLAQRRSGGALLLHTNYRTDTSFLLLNDAPPQGAVYAGSYFGALQTGAPVAGVHHARGDLQKLSTGAVESFSTCPGNYGALQCTPGGADTGQFLAVVWNRGVTESGSSGSGLFYAIGSKRYLVGQLFGGGSSCRQRSQQDQYGRFDLAFDRSLKKWLLGTDVLARE